MVFSLAACGDSSDSDSETEAAASEATDAAEDSSDAAASTGDETYVVGIVQLVQHDALDLATEGFKDALTEKLGDSVTFNEQNAAGDSATCVTIANTFVSDEVDLIMANATAALQAASAATSTIPVVGTSVTDYATALDIDSADWTGTVGTNVTGVSDLAPLEQQADMINELFPDAETVAILYCSAEPNSKFQADTITPYLEAYGYTVVEYTFADSNDVSSVTQNAADEADVIYIPTDNTAASCTEAIYNIVEPAGVPVVAGEEGIAGGCGVATLSISYYDLGYKAGEMAYEILTGAEDVSTMAISYADNVTKEYIASRCEALGITVPDDYTELEVEE